MIDPVMESATVEGSDNPHNECPRYHLHLLDSLAIMDYSPCEFEFIR